MGSETMKSTTAPDQEVVVSLTDVEDMIERLIVKSQAMNRHACNTFKLIKFNDKGEGDSVCDGKQDIEPAIRMSRILEALTKIIDAVEETDDILSKIDRLS